MVPSYKYETMRSNRCHGLVPWSITLVPTKDSLNNSQMPRARPVELHAPSFAGATARADATGSPRGVSRSFLPKTRLNNSQMPRARPVEYHARSYAGATGRFQMPRACPVELLVRSLQIVESLDDLAETERYESFAY